MSQRRYPTAELYEDRQSDFYRHSRRAPPSTREYEELDVDIRRGGGRELDFLDEDYGRPTTGSGQIVIREQPVPREARSVRARSVERDEVVVRRGDPPRRRGGNNEEIDVIIRRDEGSVRGGRREALPPRRERTRDVERDDHEVVVDHRDIRRGGRVVGHEDDVIISHNDRGRNGRFDDRETVQVRHRSRSRPRYDELPPRPPPGSLRQEEIIIDTGRRRARSRSYSSSRSPPRRRGNIDTEEIIIRRTEKREPSPVPPPRQRTPSPEPEPLPPPIMRPPIHQQIHQEIITHHRHIDHGVERAWSPEPLPPPAPRTPTPPPPPAPRKEETIEVDIRRRRRGGADEEITIDHDHHRGRHDHETSLALRPRSLSAPRRRGGGYYDDDLEEEADYYNRKAMQRAYIGEAHDGATRDWNIVDVPPGTERVRMDGAGGSAQEITWQRYNGVRRSKFLAGGREFDTGFGAGVDRGLEEPPMALAPSRPPPSKMWTEITKDLVLKDAIDAFGYDYEETEFFYYIMEYLRYEDVLQLVELSEDMREDRRRRIQEIEWEREQLRRERERMPPRRGGERYWEHEVIVDTRRRR